MHHVVAKKFTRNNPYGDLFLVLFLLKLIFNLRRFISYRGWWATFKPKPFKIIYYVVKAILRLFIYTSCMINCIFGLKQLWLQVNGHAWFYLHEIHWAVRNRLGLKNSKWKYMSLAGFELTHSAPRPVIQRLRPLGHAG